MRVINELRKLLSVKAIWIIYLLLIVSVLTWDHRNSTLKEFASTFVKNHGTGPYELDLMKDYIKFVDELNDISCHGEKYTYENCDQVLSSRSKEIRNLYPTLSYRDLHSALGVISHGDYEGRIQSINKYMEEQKLGENNMIQDFFFENMIEYHQINPRILEVEYEKVYNLFLYSFGFQSYLAVVGVVSMIMMIFSISSNHSQQDVDMIVLTSKTGRRIIKHKLCSAFIFSMMTSILCFIPVILSEIYQNNWVYFLNSKMIEPHIQHLYWFDFKLWQYLFVVFLLLVIANIFISMIISIISIYSKKLMNIIAYNLVLIASIIGLIYYFELKDSPTVFSQIIRIGLNHTPYGLIYNNANMMEYSYSYWNSYLTYREFPFEFTGLNTIVLVILIVMSYKHYKKVNL